jgi:hypothetical protein
LLSSFFFFFLSSSSLFKNILKYFFLKKLFLILAHQNNLKTLKNINFKKIKNFNFFLKILLKYKNKQSFLTAAIFSQFFLSFVLKKNKEK